MSARTALPFLLPRSASRESLEEVGAAELVDELNAGRDKVRKSCPDKLRHRILLVTPKAPLSFLFGVGLRFEVGFSQA